MTSASGSPTPTTLVPKGALGGYLPTCCLLGQTRLRLERTPLKNQLTDLLLGFHHASQIQPGFKPCLARTYSPGQVILVFRVSLSSPVEWV